MHALNNFPSGLALKYDKNPFAKALFGNNMYIHRCTKMKFEENFVKFLLN